MIKIVNKVLFLLLFSCVAFAQRQQAGNSYIGQTQARRQTERFSVLDWIMKNKKTIGEQNSKYGVGKGVGSGPYPDMVIQYRTDRSRVSRDGTELGDDERGSGRLQFLLDDMFTTGNKNRLMNIDLGVEGFYSKSAKFKALDSVTQLAHSYTETGGGMVIRPYGRSSQDTGFMVKGGYMDVDYSGLWENANTLKKVWGFYVGAEAKMYLLPFLGVYGDYLTALERDIEGLNGKWSMYRFIYGAFIEVYVLNLQAYVIDTEYGFTPNSTGIKIKEVSKGVGFAANLHF